MSSLSFFFLRLFSVPPFLYVPKKFLANLPLNFDWNFFDPILSQFRQLNPHKNTRLYGHSKNPISERSEKCNFIRCLNAWNNWLVWPIDLYAAIIASDCLAFEVD